MTSHSHITKNESETLALQFFLKLELFVHELFFSPVEFLVHLEKIYIKDMLYTIGKIRVSEFRKSTGSILQSLAKQFKD